MNKIFAEIIAGLIPHKMTRNRWRGILRYGLLRAWRLRRFLSRNADIQPTTWLAVCAIAKDEGPYFTEWIEWHLHQGVEKFYIYDNGSTDGTREILAPYVLRGVVEYIYFPGNRMQLAAYDDCLERHRLDTHWIAFIDMDEFFVPVQDSTLATFMHRLPHCSAVEINWLIYGSGGAKKHLPGTMMERFRRHSQPQHPLNRHVKSIVDPRRVYVMNGCHEVSRISGRTIDSHGNTVVQHFRQREPQQDVIRINHYAVRSYEEFQEKQTRGRASGTQKTVRDEYFQKYDLNDIEEA